MIEPVNTHRRPPPTSPADARKPDAASKGFEQLLVQQLAQAMLKTAGDTGNQYASLLPNALADAVEQGGGLGLDLNLDGGGQVTATLVRSPQLGDDVLAHLDAQIASARRLLSAVLRQGQAIRAREVEQVMARLADIQAEMGRRAALEGTRTAILTTAGAALGIPPHTVTHRVAGPAAGARRTRRRARSAPPSCAACSAEVAREHAINRVLMRQELAFLDHLMRELGAEPDTGYGALAGGAAAHAPARGPQASFRTLDLQA